MSKSYRQQFDEAIACRTKEQAEKWLLAKIESYYTLPDFKGGMQEARNIVLTNLGYMARYYGMNEQRKVFELFGTPHPIFGTPEQMEKLTPEEAFAMGQKLAKTA